MKPISQLVDFRELVHSPNNGTPVANAGPVYRVAVFGVRAERSTLIIVTQVGGYPVPFSLDSPPLRDANPHEIVDVVS